MAKIIDKLLYAITMYGIVFYLKSKFHFDDGTIKVIIEVGGFHVWSVYHQLQSFVYKDEKLRSPSNVLSVI